MSLSIFAQQIESLPREKNSFEANARQKLKAALSSFISTTEVNTQEVFFKQSGFRQDVEELEVVNGEFKFEWVIGIAHGGYNLEASVPVYAVQVWGTETGIALGVGRDSARGGQEDSEFMKNLIAQLQIGINSAFS